VVEGTEGLEGKTEKSLLMHEKEIDEIIEVQTQK